MRTPLVGTRIGLRHRRRGDAQHVRVAADDGLVDRAVEALEAVAEDMLAAGLPIDAALARRDIVEILVLAEQHERAAELARRVLDTLAAAGMFQDATRTLQLLSGRTGLGAAADSRRKRGSDS